MLLADAIGGPGDPESFGHVLYVLWTQFFVPIGSVVLAFWVYVFICWSWKRHKAKPPRKPRFYDPAHDAPYR